MRPVCEWRFSALPVLMYLKYAPLRFSKTTVSTRLDLNLNTSQVDEGRKTFRQPAVPATRFA
ncbi:hypothetical protein EOA23_22545 [Mesorhizobium sp. M2A.F.Ca.ET.042.01.1.1]|nr:hypothetical protein EOA23_22545 [Mesorhizobium sp. M2A.F.Ca.ET.042.01.1.1]